MNAPITLFDFTNDSVTLPVTAPSIVNKVEFHESPKTWPRARTSDPSTSREAAERVKPGTSALVEAIREAVRWGDQMLAAPSTQFDIAVRVEACHPRRWDEGTIRTACKRAGLVAVDTEGRSPRGSRCIRYSL